MGKARSKGVSSAIYIGIPDWLERINEQELCLNGVEERMDFVVALSSRNIAEGTGGPFGAAIFESRSGRLVSAGTNLVVWGRCSVLHAEMVAIIMAQAQIGSYDLRCDQIERELVTSTEPCAMCFGAIPWSGLRRVVAGATEEDARSIGFDEGTKVPSWSVALNDRGIDVVMGLGREKAVDVLRAYSAKKGIIYNPR